MLDCSNAKNKCLWLIFKIRLAILDRGSLPNEIIIGKLYLGSAENAKACNLLFDQMKITHIVNAA
jgi:hypothetical protein